MNGYLLPVFFAVLQLLILILVGFIARKSNAFDPSFFRQLSRFVVRFALPLYFVVRVGRADLSQLRKFASMPLASLSVIVTGLCVSYLLFSVLPYRGMDKRAGIALSAFGNSGYMPLTLAAILPTTIPVIEAAFGTELPTLLIAAFVLLYSPVLWSLGRYILSKREATERFQPKELLSPPVIGILVGLILSVTGIGRLASDPVSPIHYFFAAFEMLSNVTLPLALIALGALIGGLQVSREAFSHHFGMAVAVSSVRYLIFPGLFFGAYALGIGKILSPAALFVLFLEMHTPPATNLSLIANESGVNKEHTAVSLLTAYLLYLVAMPIYLVLFLWLVV